MLHQITSSKIPKFNVITEVMKKEYVILVIVLLQATKLLYKISIETCRGERVGTSTKLRFFVSHLPEVLPRRTGLRTIPGCPHRGHLGASVGPSLEVTGVKCLLLCLRVPSVLVRGPACSLRFLRCTEVSGPRLWVGDGRPVDGALGTDPWT